MNQVIELRGIYISLTNDLSIKFCQHSTGDSTLLFICFFDFK